MPDFNITLDDSDFNILKESKSLTIYNLQTQEKAEGDFDIPEDLIKTSTGPLSSQLQKEAQNEGIRPESYKIEYFLVLGTEEEEVNSLGYIENEKAVLTAASDMGKAEVNGFKGQYNLFLLGVCL